MNFNKYIWNLYINSEDGKAAINKDIAEFTAPSKGQTHPFHYLFDCWEYEGTEIKNDTDSNSEILNLRENIKEYASENLIENQIQADELFLRIIDEGTIFELSDDDGGDFGVTYGGVEEDYTPYSEIMFTIEGLTAGLHDAYPEYFFPYLFSGLFDEFEKILNYFEIDLPEIPGKLKRRERVLYYLKLNAVLQAFRKAQELSPKELNAFLYDFSLKNIVRNREIEIPSPTRVWFVIGGGENGDAEYMELADENSTYRWSGNLETRRGDIVLMWCTAPKSCIHSIWRAVDPGFNDPFFWYFSSIRLGKKIKIPDIKFSEISKHPLLSKKSIVRAKFQGGSGSTFSVEEYEAIKEILKLKKFNIDILPTLPNIEKFHLENVICERDVEEKLLEPLLKKLGFVDQDWIRQFPISMGTVLRNYPDYVLGAKSIKGEESAIALVECKYEINKPAELKKAFLQAKSYALRLQSSVFMIASNLGIWLFENRSDGFSLDHLKHKTWKELSNSDEIHEVSLVFGKKAIDKYRINRKIK